MPRVSDHLPALLDEIAEAVGAALKDRVAGVEAALQLARVKGGQRVHFPGRLTPGHWLTEAVGDRAAQAIVDHFRAGGRGIELDIPLGSGGSYLSQRRARARQMAAGLSAGLSANRLAASVGITRRAVLKAKSRLRGDASQRKLFED